MKKKTAVHAGHRVGYTLQVWYCHNRLPIISALVGLLTYGFGYLPLPPTGIDEPSPVAPYLNGVFPTTPPGGGQGSWEVENAFPQLTFVDPLALLEIPGEASYYVAGKVGHVWKIDASPSAATKELVLDISAMVDTDGDAGLLNAVLHPEFGQADSPNRGYLYVFYRWHPDGNISNCAEGGFLRLSRFTREDGAQHFDPASEYVLIQVYDEHCWHVGGGMFFDPDGLFYLALGDAGGVNDQFGVTQQITGRLFSGLLRIDLDRDPDRSHPIRRQQVDPPGIPFSQHSSFSQGYYIPNDNPWQDEAGGVLEEFYAIGLRNPHRMAMDEITGKIWIADVGQGQREEISIVSKGANLQWPFREGFAEAEASPPDPLIGISTPPIYDYDHAMGNSIIGGMVYHGDFYQGALEGQYIFGDHGARNVWSYNPVNGEVVFLVNIPGFGQGDKRGIASFARNSAGELFVLKLYGTDQDGGVIYRLKQASDVPQPPTLLSQTGAFTDLATLEPAPGLLPYRVNSPLWSDGAEKQRWIALPNDGSHNTADEQITFSATGNWQFPAGTVFVKHFELPLAAGQPELRRRLETRFLIISEDGGAYGLTYKWNEEGTDAELLVNSETDAFTITGPDGSQREQTWAYPSRAECMTCHNANSDFVLGVHTWQLNGDQTYPSSGITDNQLNTWHHLGMFANPFDPSEIPGFLRAAPLSAANMDLGLRVRSYLDANCAHCHRPNGVEGAFDARFSTPLAEQELIWSFGASRNTPDDHYIIKPLDTSESELWLRDGSLAGQKMPPLAKSLVDEEYMSVLTAWINSLEEEACLPVPLTDRQWLEADNGVGPVEVDESNGESQAGDGRTISINGQTFQRGLGVHAYSEISYRTNGDYDQFQAYVGIDDEVSTCNNASVYFEVYADEVLMASSSLLRAEQGPELIEADIRGAAVVKLVVQDGGDSNACDHADWGNPRFLPCGDCEPGASCDDGNDCTVNDRYNADCACIGTVSDADADGVCDSEDQCPNGDDRIDNDQDGVPDACDDCVGRYPQTCPSSDCDVVGTPIASDIYAAAIQLNSSAWVDKDSQVIFQSGQLIRLEPGFQVSSGADFKAIILTCEPTTTALMSDESSLPAALLPATGTSDSPNGRARQDQYLSVRVYPNPFTDAFRIYIVAPHPAVKRATIRVMDINGRIIYQELNAAFNREWSIPTHRGWSPGLYYLHIQCSEYQHIQTIIKH